MKNFIIGYLSIVLIALIGYIYYPKNINVEVKGEVLKPGVYTLKYGSTIKDLLDISGGANEGVDLYTINLSKKLTDGDVVVMFKEDREINTDESYDKVITNLKNNKELDNYITNEIWESSKISINKSSKEELMELPGIGESKALLIIEYRNQNGAFKKIEDIMNVKGIGKALYEKIKDKQERYKKLSDRAISIMKEKIPNQEK